MHRSLIGCAAAGALCLATFAAVSPASAAGPQPLKRVDAAKFYQGVWYEIARRPMSLTDGCVAGGTQYTPKEAGQIDVLDFCHAGGPGGELKTIGGPAQLLDPGVNAHLRVNYRFLGFIPVEQQYVVLDHASDYSWFISSDPTFHDLWIYTRAHRVSQAQLASLVKRAKALGYDVSQLEYPTQGGR